MITKVCSHCKEAKPLEEFHKMRHTAYGVSNVCKACAKIQKKKYYEANKEKYILRAKAWCEQNKDKRRKIVNEYDDRNREAKRKRNRDNLKNKRIENPEMERLKGRQASHIRRSRLQSVKVKASKEDIEFILNSTNGVCIYCNEKPAKLTIDHFIPISKGGNHEIRNLVPCCHTCNCSKNGRNGYDWLITNNNIEALKRVEKLMKKSIKREKNNSIAVL